MDGLNEYVGGWDEERVGERKVIGEKTIRGRAEWQTGTWVIGEQSV